MHSRVHSVDSLRGFSLLGILLANLLIFQYGMFGSMYISPDSIIEKISYYGTKIFIEGSAMPIFTLLFGFSLIKLMQSVQRKGRKSRWVLLRRAVGLITLGLLHSTFIWEGDILAFYGGMVLLLFIFLKRKAKTLFIWSGILFALILSFSALPAEPLPESAGMAAYLAEAQLVYSDGSYRDIQDFRLHVLPPDFDGILYAVTAIISPLIFIALFLLGMGLAKTDVFSRIHDYPRLYRLGLLLLPIGVVMKAFALLQPNFEMLLLPAGQLLSLGYIALFMQLFASQKLPRFMTAFAAVGKLSLTNYLLQSVICTFIFYGYGLGLFGQLGVTAGVLLGLAIYSCQVLISHLYLQRWQRGPVESLLRMWTYFSWRGQLKSKAPAVEDVLATK